jgi:hypothetical protein
MKNRPLTVRYNLTKEEFPYLPRSIPAGSVVYEFHGATYGCIGPRGLAVSAEPGQGPFFEVPFTAVEIL